MAANKDDVVLWAHLLPVSMRGGPLARKQYNEDMKNLEMQQSVNSYLPTVEPITATEEGQNFCKGGLVKKGYKVGGYTGDGAPDQVNATKTFKDHKGEYYINSSIVNLLGGPDNVEKLVTEQAYNKLHGNAPVPVGMQNSFAIGGPVIGNVFNKIGKSISRITQPIRDSRFAETLTNTFEPITQPIADAVKTIGDTISDMGGGVTTPAPVDTTTPSNFTTNFQAPTMPKETAVVEPITQPQISGIKDINDTLSADEIKQYAAKAGMDEGTFNALYQANPKDMQTRYGFTPSYAQRTKDRSDTLAAALKSGMDEATFNMLYDANPQDMKTRFGIGVTEAAKTEAQAATTATGQAAAAEAQANMPTPKPINALEQAGQGHVGEAGETTGTGITAETPAGGTNIYRIEGLNQLLAISRGDSEVLQNVLAQTLEKYAGDTVTGEMALRQQLAQAGTSPEAATALINSYKRNARAGRDAIASDVAGKIIEQATTAAGQLAQAGMEERTFEEGIRQFQVGSEQWNKQFDLEREKFDVGSEQWTKMYDLQLAQFRQGSDQWKATMAQRQKEFAETSQLNRDIYKSGEAWKLAAAYLEAGDYDGLNSFMGTEMGITGIDFTKVKTAEEMQRFGQATATLAAQVNTMVTGGTFGSVYNADTGVVNPEGHPVVNSMLQSMWKNSGGEGEPTKDNAAYMAFAKDTIVGMKNINSPAMGVVNQFTDQELIDGFFGGDTELANNFTYGNNVVGIKSVRAAAQSIVIKGGMGVNTDGTFFANPDDPAFDILKPGKGVAATATLNEQYPDATTWTEQKTGGDTFIKQPDGSWQVKGVTNTQEFNDIPIGGSKIVENTVYIKNPDGKTFSQVSKDTLVNTEQIITAFGNTDGIVNNLSTIKDLGIADNEILGAFTTSGLTADQYNKLKSSGIATETELKDFFGFNRLAGIVTASDNWSEPAANGMIGYAEGRTSFDTLFGKGGNSNNVPKGKMQSISMATNVNVMIDIQRKYFGLALPPNGPSKVEYVDDVWGGNDYIKSTGT